MLIISGAYGATPIIVQIAVNNPKFDIKSSETHEAIRLIHRTFPDANIAELQPGRAQKYFCEQPDAIMYPVITKPSCNAELIQIDNIKMMVFYQTESPVAVRYIGVRRGYSKKVADYEHIFTNIKQLFEAQNDQKLYTMFELGRIDAIVMEEQSAKNFALLDYPSILFSEFHVYAAVKGIDTKSLSAIDAVSK